MGEFCSNRNTKNNTHVNNSTALPASPRCFLPAAEPARRGVEPLTHSPCPSAPPPFSLALSPNEECAVRRSRMLRPVADGTGQPRSPLFRRVRACTRALMGALRWSRRLSGPRTRQVLSGRTGVRSRGSRLCVFSLCVHSLKLLLSSYNFMLVVPRPFYLYSNT